MRMTQLEERMNLLSKGRFFGGFTSRGLETYTMTEIRTLAHGLASPAFMKALRDNVVLHRDFYLKQYRVRSLTRIPAGQDTCAANIAAMCRWLDIPQEAP